MTAEIPLSKDVTNQYMGDMLKMLPGAVLYREPWEHQGTTSGLCVSLTVRLQSKEPVRGNSVSGSYRLMTPLSLRCLSWSRAQHGNEPSLCTVY